jgi:GTP cyclohydrolase II
MNLRDKRGLSQGEIAKKLGISRPTYVLIEQGKKDLTLSQAQTLSSVFNVPIETIQKRRIEKVDFLEQDIVTAQIPTEFGVFDFSVWNQIKGEEIVFLATPKLDLQKSILVRVHSECMTGDIFHSYRCDCGEQKDKSLQMISESGNGVFIYLRQEGRGIGLHEKIKAYLLQDQGYDTHEANIMLGHKPDYREYSWVKKVLDYLNIKEIKLLTNNPSKVSEISRLDIKVTERVPLIVESNSYNRKYFETKKQKFKHFFGNEESNYFYQFSYAENAQQVEEIGNYLSTINKDPFLKICIGVYADTHTLSDVQALRNIEAIFKAAEHFESFVPILHFTFKFSSDTKKDISTIRSVMPYIKYLRLNDLFLDHLQTLIYANKFFLTDIPITDELMHLVDDPASMEKLIL